MDWFDCPDCIYRHPFQVGAENVCPNRRLTEAKCQEVFHRDLNKVLKPGVTQIPALEPVEFIPASKLDPKRMGDLEIKDA